MAILATAVWRVRPSGNNLNGGGYDPGIAGAATDYSQQNAAQAIGTNGTTTGAGATTFTDATAGAFTAAMIGNAILIASGTNFQVGVYFVTAFTNANSVVLDRTPTSGGAGSVGVWKLGGGWADFLTNTTNAVATQIPVGGNTVFILGSGTPNPASYVYDYTITGAINGGQCNGSATTGQIKFANDPATPGYRAPPDTTGGMPTIRFSVGSIMVASTYVSFSGLWFVANLAASGVAFTAGSSSQLTPFIGCVLDQFGIDFIFFSTGLAPFIGCELFSSVAPGGNGTNYITSTNSASVLMGCNVHDTVGPAFYCKPTSASGGFYNCIFAKCRGNAITFDGTGGASDPTVVVNCTIDGNLGNGIEFITQGSLNYIQVFNNIISNHVTASTFGIKVDTGTAAQNTALASFCDYNVYYNNTVDLSNLNYGPHDTHGGLNPYVAQSTENYTLA